MSELIDTPGSAGADAAVQADLCFQRGVAAGTAGRVDEAVDWFRRAVALRPGFGPAQANLGMLLVALGRSAQAEAPLQAAVDAMPADAFLRNALGMVLVAANRMQEAEDRYREALALQSDFPEALANLGNCLKRQGRPEEAQPHYARAVELRPAFAAAHCGLGNLQQDAGCHEEAVAHYRTALVHEPRHIEAMNNLGSSLRKHGDLPGARAAFERVLALNPEQVEAHCNLAQLKTYASGDPQVERFLSLRRRLPTLPEHGRVRYWFTAGKMLEDTGRHDEAFAAYAEGNRLKHVQTVWDAEIQADLCRRLMATFTREFMAQRDGNAIAPEEGPVPVFIVGMPRSGTSLLEQVLATLPGVHAAGELTFLGETLQSAASELAGGAFRFPESMAACTADDFRRLGRRYLDRVQALAPQATHVVDKLPANFMHLGLVRLMLPHARVVHAMRDPMDACFSCYSRLFSGDNLGYSYDLGLLGRYWRGYDALMRHWREVLPPGFVLDLPYEAMVADFEPQARRLVAHLGLPWDARCLDFHSHRRVVKTASVAQVCRPIYGSSVARWKPFERHLARLREIVEGALAPDGMAVAMP